MQNLLNQRPVKDVASIPGAIKKFERDLEIYADAVGTPFPEEWKVPTFLQILPKAQASELKLRFAQGLGSYKALTDHLLTYGQQVRMEGAFGRGDNDVDLYSLDWNDLGNWELETFMEGFAAGLAGEEPAEATEEERPAWWRHARDVST